MKLLLMTLFFALVGCSTTAKQLKNYEADGNKLRDLITQKSATTTEITKLSQSLIDQAVPLLNDFSKKKPECKPVLDFIIKNAGPMQNISLSKIERDFHDGEALPKSEDHCYNAKELIVHPATVVILAKKPLNKKSREKMLAEIDEVLAHLDLYSEDSKH